MSFEDWKSAGMRDVIVCIWAKEDDVICWIDDNGFNHSGPVTFSTGKDERKIIHVNGVMIGVNENPFGHEWLIRPDVRCLINCTQEVVAWQNRKIKTYNPYKGFQKGMDD